MSQFVVVSTNSRSNLGCILKPFESVLEFAAVGSGGWGLGYYNRGELLSRVEPRDRGESFQVMERIGDIEAEAFILHTRAATIGSVRRENTHPFRFQNWAFAHNGTLEGFDDYRERILEAMPPFIRRRVQGDTDSELLFHLFLSFMFDAGTVNRTNPGTATIRDALVSAISMVDNFARKAGHQLSDSSVVISDGYSVVTLGRGIPVSYSLIEGVADCEFCRTSRVPKTEPSSVDHRELRAVLIRSGPAMVGSRLFQDLEDNHLLSVTSDHRVEFDSFS